MTQLNKWRIKQQKQQNNTENNITQKNTDRNKITHKHKITHSKEHNDTTKTMNDKQQKQPNNTENTITQKTNNTEHKINTEKQNNT